MIRHVAFDFDGTLVQSNRTKRQSFYDATAGLDGAAAVLDELFAGGFRGDRFALMREVARRLERCGAAADPGALAAEYGRLCRERIAAAPEVPGARPTLEALRAAGAQLYLVSATPQDALHEVVADRGLDAFFARVLGTPTEKASHLRGIMADLGVAPDDLAMVGDGSDDRRAASAVGCRFVAVDGGSLPVAEGEPRVADLRDLPRLLGHAGASTDALDTGAPR